MLLCVYIYICIYTCIYLCIYTCIYFIYVRLWWLFAKLICSKWIKGIFLKILILLTTWERTNMLYANICLSLLQQSKTTNTIQNILQSNLRGTACSRKYAESVTWLTQVQQAITDLPIAVDSLSHVELSRVKNIHSINRNFCWSVIIVLMLTTLMYILIINHAHKIPKSRHNYPTCAINWDTIILNNSLIRNQISY